MSSSTSDKVNIYQIVEGARLPYVSNFNRRQRPLGLASVDLAGTMCLAQYLLALVVWFTMLSDAQCSSLIFTIDRSCEAAGFFTRKLI